MQTRSHLILVSLSEMLRKEHFTKYLFFLNIVRLKERHGMVFEIDPRPMLHAMIFLSQ